MEGINVADKKSDKCEKLQFTPSLLIVPYEREEVRSIACLHFRPLINLHYRLAGINQRISIKLSLNLLPFPPSSPFALYMLSIVNYNYGVTTEIVGGEKAQGACILLVARRYAEKSLLFLHRRSGFPYRVETAVERGGRRTLVNPFGILALIRRKSDTCERSRRKSIEFLAHAMLNLLLDLPDYFGSPRNLRSFCAFSQKTMFSLSTSFHSPWNCHRSKRLSK